MNSDLFNYLKCFSNQDWLGCFEKDSNQKLNPKNYANKQLEQLINKQIVDISLLKSKCTAKVAIFIVETEPIKFMAAYLAGVIMEVDIFLCNPAWQLQEWQQVLDIVCPDLICADERIKLQIQSTILQLKIRQKNPPKVITELKFTEISLIMIPTGGTSGKIKFAIHSWETLTASVNGFKDFFNCQQINSVCTLPLYHVSGLMQLMRSLLTQGNLIICPYKSIVPKLNHLDKSVYFISLVPTQLEFLLNTQPDDLQKFKIVLVGGAPSKRSLLDTAKVYNIPIVLTYGMTETASGVVALKPDAFLAGNLSNGQVLPHAQIKISNSSTDDRAELFDSIKPTNNHQTGLIEITSTSLCLGYYPQTFTFGQSFLTDDLGYFDDDNYLHLLGRNSQKIITGGENVFPAEVEAVIYATKLVQDVCVVGIPDQKWGEAVTAIYVPLKLGNNLQLIKQQIKSQLAQYKQPKHWLQIEQIPRNDRGKVNVQKLKAIALKKLAQERL